MTETLIPLVVMTLGAGTPLIFVDGAGAGQSASGIELRDHTGSTVRGLALGQVTSENARELLVKEFLIAVLNGLIWGALVGLFAFVIYHSWQLGLVMTAAMLLNLVLAAVMGLAIPMTMYKLGRDPALGSSVLVTAITDSGGFFIFLGLATLFLV